MKQSICRAGQLSLNPLSGIFNRVSLIPLASVALLLSACGGGGSDSGSGQTIVTPPPILQVGMQRQYVGTTTQSVVYANPTGTQQNYTLAYSTTRSLSVLQAASNAPAPFDVHSDYTYTLTQDPGVGSVPISETVDAYENLIVSGSGQAASTVAETTTTVENDETSNALGGGPYTSISTSNFTYPTPQIGFFFPLQTGATLSVPQAYVNNFTFSDLNASGMAPPNGQNLAYTGVETQNIDGSFTTQRTRTNGVSLGTTVNSNGSASFWSTGGNNVYTTTIGVPVSANGAYTIPVNYAVTAPTASNTNYTATDWYPGNGLPTTPLRTVTETVIGPTASLPAACNGALVQSDMVEVDTTENILNPAGSATVSTTRSFNSNNVAVCSLVQTTGYTYNVYTGALSTTTTTQSTTMLAAITSAN